MVEEDVDINDVLELVGNGDVLGDIERVFCQ